MIAMPDPVDVPHPALAARGQGDRPHVLRRPGARRRALRGRPALGHAPRARAHAGDGLRRVLHRARARVLLLPLRRDRRRPAARCSTRAATSTSRRSTPARTCAARRCWRWSSSASTSSTRHHEVGPSQHEVDMRYADALKMADDCMTYRITVKEYAMKYGFYATFMPKPLYGENGSGMHVHQSLFKGGRNAFYDANDQYFLSDVAKSFIAGPAQARARDRGAVRAVGQLLQAAGARLRGAGLRRVVAAQPLGADPGAALPPRQGAGDALRDPQPRPVLQPVPVLLGAAAGGARGHREGLRAARADGAEPLPPVAGRAQEARHRAAAGDARRGDRDRGRSRS